MSFLARLNRWWNGPKVDLNPTPLDPPKELKPETAQKALLYLREQTDALEIEASVILRRKRRLSEDA